MNKRDRVIDFARGVSIISIVAGHLGIFEIQYIVYTFHVPIFFCITGYFFNYKKFNLKKYIKNLIKPYFFTVLVSTIFIYIKSCINKNNCISIENAVLNILYANGYSENKTLLKFDNNQIGPIWFLFAEFWVVIFLYFISKNESLVLQVLSTLLIFSIGLYSSKFIWLPFSVQAGMIGLPFAVVSFLFKKKYDYIHIIKNKLIIFIALIFWFIDIIYCFYKKDYLLICAGKSPNVLVTYFGAISAIIVILYISDLFVKNKCLLIDCVCSMGQYSLIVLCFHTIEHNLIPYYLIKHYFNISPFIFLIFEIILLLVMIKITLKNVFLKKIFNI